MQRRAVRARWAVAVGACLGGWPRHVSAQTPARATSETVSDPQLDWDRPIWCLTTADGTVYAQCDDARKSCLYHDGCEPGTRGSECRSLERTKGCEPAPSGVDYGALLAHGTRFVRARAEAPPGWARDWEGRVFQTEFDLGRRVWIGGRWAPSFGPESIADHELGRVAIEAGLRAELLAGDTTMRHRLQVLTGEVALNPLGVRAWLFRYDASNESETPLFRVSTFWPPARHDVYLDVGPWLDVMGVEHRPRNSDGETHWHFIAGGFTWEPWHDLDLVRYLRLRGGAGFEDLYRYGDDNHRLALTPIAALETELPVDDAGRHRLVVGSRYEAPLIFDQGESEPPRVAHRFVNEASYELIVVAINDQPITVRFNAEGGYRSDIDAPLDGWALEAGAGLRVNLWAPAPDADDRRRVREQRGAR